MRYFVHHSWHVRSGHVHRMSCVDERLLHSFAMSASIRTVSSIQWYRSTREPIYRWSKPWMQSMPRNREPMAEGRQPSIWTTTTMATKVSLSSCLFHELKQVQLREKKNGKRTKKKEKKQTRNRQNWKKCKAVKIAFPIRKKNLHLSFIRRKYFNGYRSPTIALYRLNERRVQEPHMKWEKRTWGARIQ